MFNTFARSAAPAQLIPSDRPMTIAAVTRAALFRVVILTLPILSRRGSYFFKYQTFSNEVSLMHGIRRGKGRPRMASRFFAIGTAAVLTTIAAAAAVSTLRQTHLRPSVLPGSAHLHAFGTRSAQQRHSANGGKFDGALADLSRHAAAARPD